MSLPCPTLAEPSSRFPSLEDIDLLGLDTTLVWSVEREKDATWPYLYPVHHFWRRRLLLAERRALHALRLEQRFHPCVQHRLLPRSHYVDTDYNLINFNFA
jgi:hypothetical protein